MNGKSSSSTPAASGAVKKLSWHLEKAIEFGSGSFTWPTLPPYLWPSQEHSWPSEARACPLNPSPKFHSAFFILFNFIQPNRSVCKQASPIHPFKILVVHICSYWISDLRSYRAFHIPTCNTCSFFFVYEAFIAPVS